MEDNNAITHKDIQDKLLEVEGQILQQAQHMTSLRKQQTWLLTIGVTLVLAAGGAIYNHGMALSVAITELKEVRISQGLLNNRFYEDIKELDSNQKSNRELIRSLFEKHAERDH